MIGILISDSRSYDFGLLEGVLKVLLAIIMTGLNTSTQPAENILIARYTSQNPRGLIFGLKFVEAIGFSSLGVLLEGLMFDLTGDFLLLFLILGTVALVATTAAFSLPAVAREPFRNLLNRV